MNTTKLTIQFGLILIVAIISLYFSREIQKEELAAKAAEERLFTYNPDLPQYFEEDDIEDKPIVQRVELNLDDEEDIESDSVFQNIEPSSEPNFPQPTFNHSSLKTLNNQGYKILTDEDLKPYINVRHLDLSGNQLTDLPRFLLKMPHLEELILDDNNFESIPYFLRHCKQLQEIRINNNPLTSIGLNLFKMNQLRILNMENTTLKRLPKFPDRPDLIVVLPEKDYSNKSKEKLSNYLSRKYKYTLFELF